MRLKKAATVREFETLLGIDQDSLDDAIMQQPMLYWWVGERLSDLQSERDAKKQEIEQEEAEVAIDLQRQLDKKGKKYTQKQIDQRVMLDDEVKRLREELRQIQSELARFNRLEIAFADRSKMLTNLSRLYATDYYASPSRVGGTEVKERQHDATRRVLAEDRRRRSSRVKRNGNDDSTSKRRA